MYCLWLFVCAEGGLEVSQAHVQARGRGGLGAERETQYTSTHFTTFIAFNNVRVPVTHLMGEFEENYGFLRRCSQTPITYEFVLIRSHEISTFFISYCLLIWAVLI
jgi:hypothetical protein